jgi:hypothetical protein
MLNLLKATTWLSLDNRSLRWSFGWKNPAEKPIIFADPTLMRSETGFEG